MHQTILIVINLLIRTANIYFIRKNHIKRTSLKKQRVLKQSHIKRNKEEKIKQRVYLNRQMLLFTSRNVRGIFFNFNGWMRNSIYLL